MLLAFERRDEMEQQVARGLVNETTLVVDESLMKSNISASRLFMDSRLGFDLNINIESGKM